MNVAVSVVRSNVSQRVRKLLDCGRDEAAGPCKIRRVQNDNAGPRCSGKQIVLGPGHGIRELGLAYSPLQLCIACIAGIWARPWPFLRSVKGLWLSEAMA